MKIYVKAKGRGASLENVSVNALKSRFAQYGMVNDVTIADSQRYAYVTMGNDNDATRAINDLHETELLGQTLIVEEAGQMPAVTRFNRGPDYGNVLSTRMPEDFHQIPGRTKLVVKCLPKGLDKVQLINYLSDVTAPLDLHILKAPANSGSSPKFYSTDCLVNVDDMMAEEFITHYNGNVWDDDGKTPKQHRTIKIFYSSGRSMKKRTPPTSLTKLVLFNLDERATEENVTAKFMIFGHVEDVHIMKKGDNVTGFIHLDTAVAQKALEYLNDTPFFGKSFSIIVSNKNNARTHAGTGLPLVQTGLEGYKSDNNPQGQVQSMNMAPMMMTPMTTPMPMPTMTPVAQPAYSGDNPQVNQGGFTDPASAALFNNLVRRPQNQGEVDDLIRQREILEKMHPYEKYLIENYSENATNMPDIIPPQLYMSLLRDRSITKVKLNMAIQDGFAVYSGAAPPVQNLEAKYGFSTVVSQQQVNNGNATYQNNQQMVQQNGGYNNMNAGNKRQWDKMAR